MSMSDPETTYEFVSYIIGWVCGAVIFIAVMIAAIGSVGWVIGIALGWIPALLAGTIAAFALRYIWPVFALGIAYILLLLTK